MSKYKSLKDFFDACHWVYQFDNTKPIFYLYYEDHDASDAYPWEARFVPIAHYGMLMIWTVPIGDRPGRLEIAESFRVWKSRIADLCDEACFQSDLHYKPIHEKIRTELGMDIEHIYFNYGDLESHYRTFVRMSDHKNLINPDDPCLTVTNE